MSTVDIKLGTNIERGVTAVNIPDADTAGVTHKFTYGSSPMKLGTPQIQNSGSLISWETITNADNYLICRDGVVISITSLTHYDIGSDYGHFTVKAIGSGYTDSEHSNEIVISLPKPADLTNTHWRFHNTIYLNNFMPSIPTIGSGSDGYSSRTLGINYTRNGKTYTGLLIQRHRHNNYPTHYQEVGIYENSAYSYYFYYPHGTAGDEIPHDSPIAKNIEDSYEIYITGGNSVTDSKVIDWIFSNAEQFV